MWSKILLSLPYNHAVWWWNLCPPGISVSSPVSIPTDSCQHNVHIDTTDCQHTSLHQVLYWSQLTPVNTMYISIQQTVNRHLCTKAYISPHWLLSTQCTYWYNRLLTDISVKSCIGPIWLASIQCTYRYNRLSTDISVSRPISVQID